MKFLSVVVPFLLLIISCKEDNKTIKKEVKRLSSNQIESITNRIFNIEARIKSAMPILNIEDFKIVKANKEEIIYKKDDSLSIGKVFMVEYDMEHSLVLESFRLKDDYILRLQKKLLDTLYEKKQLYPILFGTNSGKLLNFLELEDLCKECNLPSKQDTVFYGYKLEHGVFVVNKSENLTIDGFSTQDLEKDPFEQLSKNK